MKCEVCGANVKVGGLGSTAHFVNLDQEAMKQAHQNLLQLRSRKDFKCEDEVNELLDNTIEILEKWK